MIGSSPENAKREVLKKKPPPLPLVPEFFDLLVAEKERERVMVGDEQDEEVVRLLLRASHRDFN